jgi:hypothetical protein
LLVLSTFFLAACGGGESPSSGSSSSSSASSSSGSGGGPAAPPIPFDEFMKQLSERACASLIECHRFENEAACESVIAPRFAQLAASVNAGRATYDPEHAAECLDDIASGFGCSNNAIYTNQNVPRVSSCYSEVVVGKGSNGASCVAGPDCASGICDAPSCPEGCCAGKCWAPATSAPGPARKVGESCGGGAGECDDVAYCPYGAPGPLTCIARSALGASCELDTECAGAGVFCATKPSSPNGKGVCVMRGAPGQACDPGEVPYPHYQACDRIDDYCDQTTKVCTPRPAAGDGCDADLGKLCVETAWCKQGKCVERSALGGSCVPNNTTTADECAYDTECSSAKKCELTSSVCP